MTPTWDGYKEARVGVVYEPSWGVGRTPAAEAGLRKEYFATTGSRESLVRAVCLRARERAGDGVVAVGCDEAALDWVALDRNFRTGWRSWTSFISWSAWGRSPGACTRKRRKCSLGVTVQGGASDRRLGAASPRRAASQVVTR